MYRREKKDARPDGAESWPFELLLFQLDDRRFAVPLSVVKRVERIAAVTPLPKAPAIVEGIINYHGQVIPVVNVRNRFGLPPREPGLNDHLLILDTGQRTLAFIIDAAQNVIPVSTDRYVDSGTVFPGMEYVKGVVKLEDGMVLIHDPDTFLSLEEESVLDEAIKGEQV